jgi:hypothetical protein
MILSMLDRFFASDGVLKYSPLGPPANEFEADTQNPLKTGCKTAKKAPPLRFNALWISAEGFNHRRGAVANTL